MKALHYCIIALVLLASCDDSSQSSTETIAPINDTRFIIACKLVDKTWDTTWTDMPQNTNFFIDGSNGTYYLAADTDRDGYGDYNVRSAAIDFNIVRSRLLIDTVTRKVELLTPDAKQ